MAKNKRAKCTENISTYRVLCTYAFVAVAVDCCRLKIKEGRFAYNIRMYEITISAPDSQRLLLANVVNSAQPALCEMDGISAEVREGTRLFFRRR